MSKSRWGIGIVAVLAVAVIALCIAGCGDGGSGGKGTKGSKAASGGIAYKKFGISIELPKDWKLTERQNMVAAMAPQKDKKNPFSPNITIIAKEMGSELSLAEAFDAYLKEIPKILEKVNVARKGDATIGGQSAKWVLLHHDIIGMKIAEKRYVLVKGKKQYTITYSARDAEFDTGLARFEEAVKTFGLE